MSSKKRSYKIDWTRNTFTMTKAFADRASQMGTEEYEQLTKVRANGFNVIEKKPKPRKACPTRMTYKQMKTYFSTLPTKKEELMKFKATVEESKSYHNPYEYVRQWFLRGYPGYMDSLRKNSKKKEQDSDVNLQIVPGGSEPEKIGA